MSRWFEIDATGILNSYAIQSLPLKRFKEEMDKALSGEASAFDGFIRGPYSRPHAHEWRVIRERIFARDDYRCTYCGERGGKLECDHIVPVSKGGGSDDENLTTSCKSCNRSKGGKSVGEWKK